VAEEWRLIADFPLYEVSSIGRIRYIGTYRSGTFHGRILKQQVLPNGYLHVGLSRGQKGSTRRALVHRIVAGAFLGLPLPNQQVNHRDGVKTNNDATNLEWVTSSQNNRHAHATGLNHNNSEKGRRGAAARWDRR
jgi:hypothetical protein